MTSKEFVLWLKGFTEGVHEFAITPKQWDYLKEKLTEVDDNTIPMGGVIVDHNTFKNVYPNWTGIPPYGTRGPETPTDTTITTTPGTGYITISNPNIASFGTGSTGILNTYNPSTSTTYGYPSGSAWSYTNSTDKKIF
jgi:hypothetical protein